MVTLTDLDFRSSTSKDGTVRWPKGRPKYLQFHLYKEDCDHTLLFNQLGKELKFAVRSDRFNVAGMKDKRGRTVQRVTVPWITPEMLINGLNRTRKKLKRNCKVEVSDFKYVEEKIELGHLKGNRFCIVIRNVNEVSTFLKEII